MGRLKYVFSRLRELHYDKMLEAAKVVHRETGKSTAFALADIVRCGFKYNAGYTDYMLFEFFKLTDSQRATYITRGINNAYVARLNDKAYWHLFENKIEFNKLFSDYMKRDWCYLAEMGQNDFAVWAAGRDKLIAKPVDETCGRGILLLSEAELTSPISLYHRLIEGNQLLVEQYVVQHSEMSRLYAGSVNTIRLVTMLTDEGPEIVFSCIRVGNGKYVDNLNSGGMSAMVDVATGKISHPAADKDGIIYERHPATGVAFVGFEIPHYFEALEMVKKAAYVVPQVRLIGWDVAIDKDGPLLIEANHFPGHDIYQLKPNVPDGIGFKPVFDAAIAKCK